MTIINQGNYHKKAEDTILRLKNEPVKDKKGRLKKVKMISTSQLRNILAMSADIYNQVVTLEGELTDEINSRIEYLRIRCIYEIGREISKNPDDVANHSVKYFMDYSDIPKILQEINGEKKNFILFNHYLEALVAFRKYYGGKDE